MRVVIRMPPSQSVRSKVFGNSFKLWGRIGRACISNSKSKRKTPMIQLERKFHKDFLDEKAYSAVNWITRIFRSGKQTHMKLSLWEELWKNKFPLFCKNLGIFRVMYLRESDEFRLPVFLSSCSSLGNVIFRQS